MSKHSAFKPSQLFDWESEPVDERPSEFMSTGYSSLSGYHGISEAPRLRTRSSSRIGFKSMLVFGAVMIAAGGYALIKIAPLLHGLHAA